MIKMLGKKLFIIVSLMSWVSISSQSVYAQLLEDRNKLKTVKRKGGFVLFQKKVKTSKPSGKHKTVYRKTPSSAKSTAGQGVDRKVFPKYSQSTAGQDYDRYVKPKSYTWKHVERNVVINPRFTKPLRYGKTKPAGNRKKGFLPSFYIYKKPPKRKPSPSSQYPGIIKTKTPQKFHVGNHNQNVARYSKYISKSLTKRKPSPSSQYAGIIKIKTPQKFHVGNHNQNVARYSKYISKSHVKSPNADKATYTGHITNLKKRKNMHPSANYLSAKGNSPTVRDAKRKFNIVWVRMNENKIEPKATTRKVKKLKFDKDEKDIWNN